MHSDSIKVAIVDDHNMMRNGLTQIISSFEDFVVVVEANNGKELLAHLETATFPDIFILDIEMQQMNGYDTLITLKKKWTNIKVLVLTMFNNEFSIIKMLKNGANGYLLKNANPQELKKALSEIYYNDFYYSDIVSKHLHHLIKNKERILPNITDKELKFLSYCGIALTYKEIAQKMDISVRTVHQFRDNLFGKLKINTHTALAIYAIKMGIVSINDD